jgi:hypothetical protein
MPLGRARHSVRADLWIPSGGQKDYPPYQSNRPQTGGYTAAEVALMNTCLPCRMRAEVIS